MDEIRVGDLVMVVRGALCCGAFSGSEGKVFRVTGFASRPEARVQRCYSDLGPAGVVGANGCSSNRTIELERLKKIPPLTEPESIEHTEEITA